MRCAKERVSRETRDGFHLHFVVMPATNGIEQFRIRGHEHQGRFAAPTGNVRCCPRFDCDPGDLRSARELSSLLKIETYARPNLPNELVKPSVPIECDMPSVSKDLETLPDFGLDMPIVGKSSP
jgi:hypothetical protein